MKRMLLSVLAAICAITATNAQAPTPDDLMRPFIAEGIETAPSHFFEGNVYMGRPDAWPGAPDCFWRYRDQRPNTFIHGTSDGTPKLHCRGVVLSDIGDPPDLVLRRAGPDGVPYNHPNPEPTTPTASLGALQWMAWGGRCEPGQFGWKAGCGNQGRNAQIFARAVGEQTGQSRAGDLHFGTSPLGNPGNPLHRVTITAEGEFRVWRQDGQNVWTTILKDAPMTDGGTSITLTARINGTTVQRPVTAGPPNSCGAGFRCLIIPN